MVIGAIIILIGLISIYYSPVINAPYISLFSIFIILIGGIFLMASGFMQRKEIEKHDKSLNLNNVEIDQFLVQKL